MPVTETYILVPTSFVALRALVREIIPNAMHTQYLPTQYPLPSHPHTWMAEIGFSSIVWLRLRVFGAQLPSELVRSHAWHDSDGGNAVYIFFCVIVCLLN